MKDITRFIETLQTNPQAIQFADVIALIDTHYDHQPTAFTNGAVKNEAGENQGSAKVFSFARLHNLDETETLLCFAEHFRSVTDTPAGSDHQNIRQFIVNGWSGMELPEGCLTLK